MHPRGRKPYDRAELVYSIARPSTLFYVGPIYRQVGIHARIQVFLGVIGPPLRLSAIFFCLVICPGPCNNLDPLLKFLYEPPPLLNV